MTKRRHLGRDIALYTTISLLVVAIVIAAALSNLPEPLIMKWFGMILFTAFVFGFLVEKSQSFWRVNSFWAWLGCLFALHCGALAVNPWLVDIPKCWWFFGLEGFALLQLTKRIFRRKINRPKHHERLTNL